MVRDVTGEAHLVRHHHHRFALFGQLLHDAQHFANEFRVQRGGRFVEQQHLRFHRQRAGDGDALLLTAGEMHRVFHLLALVDTHFRQVFHRALAGFLLAQAQHLNRRFHHVLQHRHVAPEVEVLEHHRQARTQQSQLVFIRDLQLAVFVTDQVNILPAHHNRAFARLFEEVNAAQEGTFTRAG